MHQKTQLAEKTNAGRCYINYQNMFWLFMIGNIVGFVLEGVFCVFKYGHWESHVVTIWGPFCMIYGIGAVVMYVGAALLRDKNILIKFLVIGLTASVVELLCGLLLEFGMGMRAWNYTRHFLNIRGHISLKMCAVWDLLGVAFAYLLTRPLDAMFRRIKGKRISAIACIVLSVFMAVNMLATLGCMVRWKQRHNGIEPKTKIDRFIDRLYDDERMEKRFVEWRFLDNRQESNEDDS